MMPRRKNKISQNAGDYGTPEMARHFSIVPKLSDPTTLSGKVLDGNEIDKLLLHDHIDPSQHATLNLLGKRLHGYGFVGLKSPDYSSPVFSDPTIISDKKAHTIRGAVNLIKKIDAACGSYTRKRLVNLCCADAQWGSDIALLHACCRSLDDIFTTRS